MTKTVTDARLMNSLKSVNTIINSDDISKQIDDKVSDSIALKGKIIKFYPLLDKVKVKLSDNKEVLASILHKCAGSTVDFFTPDGEIGYDKQLDQQFIDPMEKTDCLVLKIKGNKNEYVLLGYYFTNKLQQNVPAEPNCWQIINYGFPEIFALRFKNGEFNVISRNGIGLEKSNMGNGSEVIFADDKETYTKKEVDDIIKKLKEDNGLV